MAILEDPQMMDLLFQGQCYPTKDTTVAKNLDGDASEFQVYLAWQGSNQKEPLKRNVSLPPSRLLAAFPSYNMLSAL